MNWSGRLTFLLILAFVMVAALLMDLMYVEPGLGKILIAIASFGAAAVASISLVIERNRMRR
jgi:hypothetical protein